jgi:para-nitrobenzyl esterase
MSEDCLTLNIWAPSTADRTGLPVMVWIHGGGFFRGSAVRSDTDGSALARQGVVVVTINYRLGVFGFLAHPLLSRESTHQSSGNYGLLDQIAALQWIQRNIAAFGGDPRRVTIFGESAGGCSVMYLLLSPLTRGLFAQAISQSAGLVYFPSTHLRRRWYGRDSAESSGARLGGDLAALRSRSAADILAASRTRTDIVFGDDGVEYFPAVDGWVLPDDPATLFDEGRFAHVPLMLGTNADEGTLFGANLPFTTVVGWRDYASRRFPGASEMLAAQYPVTDAADVFAAAVRMVTDWVFLGTNRAIARAASRRDKVFVYRFSRVNPRLQPVPGLKAGAFHSMEIGYVFGSLPAPRGPLDLYDDTDRALSMAMSLAWARFAKTGDPNGAGLPAWPRFELASERYLEFGDEIRTAENMGTAGVDMFDAAFAAMRQVR